MDHFSVACFFVLIFLTFVTNDVFNLAYFGKITGPVDYGFWQNKFQTDVWQVVNNTHHIKQHTEGRTFMFITNSTEETKSHFAVLNDFSVTMSFSYAIFKSNLTLPTKLTLELMYDEGERIKLFQNENTNGTWQNESFCFPHTAKPYKFVFNTEASVGDEIAIAEIEVLRVYSCFHVADTVECTFNDLCNWTVNSNGTEWQISNTSGLSSTNNSFLQLKYNDHNQQEIEVSQLETSVLANHSPYLEISFSYYTISHATNTPQLKIRMKQPNAHWLFDSIRMRSNRNNKEWRNETICTNVRTRNSYTSTQVIFHGEVETGTEIGLDNVVLRECFYGISLNCSFENDVCGWDMILEYNSPWEVARDSSNISPRVENQLFLQVIPDGEIKRYAQLVSPPLVAQKYFKLSIWYYIDDEENVTSTLKIGLQPTSTSFIPLMEIFNQSEELNAKWREISLNVTDIEEGSKIRIYAVVPPGCYLAIDDVTVVLTDNEDINGGITGTTTVLPSSEISQANQNVLTTHLSPTTLPEDEQVITSNSQDLQPVEENFNYLVTVIRDNGRHIYKDNDGLSSNEKITKTLTSEKLKPKTKKDDEDGGNIMYTLKIEYLIFLIVAQLIFV